MLYCCLLIFSKSTFSKNSLKITIRMSNSWDPDQARHFVGPDLGPNCLQQLSADDTSRQIVNSQKLTRGDPSYLSPSMYMLFIVVCFFRRWQVLLGKISTVMTSAQYSLYSQW